MQRYTMECALVLEGEGLPIFPLLMPASWARTSPHVWRPFVSGTGVPDVPVVTLVHFVGEPNSGVFRRVNLRAERFASIDKTIADGERAACHNVGQRGGTWTTGAGGRIAICSDDFLAAERMLDPPFMRAGAAALGAAGRPILAAAPYRGCLMAAPLEIDAASLRAFQGLVEYASREPRGEPISRWPFLFIDGVCNTIMEIAA